MDKILDANKISIRLLGKAVVNYTERNNLDIKQYFDLVKSNIVVENYNFLNNDDLINVVELLENYVVKKSDLVKTFYKNLSDVLNKSEIELRIDQIIHYATTYGIDFKTDMYHQNDNLDKEVVDTLEQVIFIESLSIDEFENEITEILYSNTALNSELVSEILDYVIEYDVNLSIEKIQNKEFLRGYKYRKGIIENIEDIVTRIVYQRSGKFMNIKSKHYFKKDVYAYDIEEVIIDYIEKLSKDDMIELSKSFNRYKTVWIYIKKSANEKLVTKNINKIAKLSKKHHKPLKTPNYQKISELSIDEFSDVIKGLDFTYLVKVGRFLKYRIEAYKKDFNYLPLVVRVRNGKKYVTEAKLPERKDLEKKYVMILSLLKLKVKKFFIDEKISIEGNVNIALPLSEKQFIGNFPIGSKISFKNENVFFGISWKGKGVDYDLSALSENEKIGWNGEYKNDDLFFSGDITSAPKGATELIFTKRLKNSYEIKTNLFGDSNNAKGFKFFIGNKELTKKINFNKDIEEIVSPDDIVFNYFFENEGGITLGMIEDKDFTFLNFEDENNVSVELNDIEMAAKMIYKDSFVTLKDILSDDDIDAINCFEAETTFNLNNPDKQILLKMMRNS